MKIFSTTFFLCVCCTMCMGANLELWDGSVITNAQVLFQNPKDIFVSYRNHGVLVTKNIPLSDLSKTLQRKYGYDEKVASDFIDEQNRKISEHEQLRAKSEKAQREQDRLLKAKERQVEQNAVVSSKTNVPTSSVSAATSRTQEWQVLKSTHSRIYYKDSKEFVEKVSKCVEDRFEDILKRVDSIKGLDLAWSMDNSIKIYVYSSQKEMTTEHKLNEWASGVANFQTKTICMLNTEDALKNTLAHELGHQVFFDMMGGRNVPDWLSEGVAQWLESDESRAANQKRLIKYKKDGSLFSLNYLVTVNESDLDAEKASIFYCQSMSLVGYMINVNPPDFTHGPAYGFSIFKLFCDQIQNRVSLQNALLAFYANKFTSVKELENAWFGSEAQNVHEVEVAADKNSKFYDATTYLYGQRYEGDLRDGERHGYGTMTWPDGQKYTGEWSHNKFNGQGKLFLSVGAKYSGGFKNGQYSGQGSMITTSGEEYTGEWANGVRHGTGTHIYPDGRVLTGKWVDNVFVP